MTVRVLIRATLAAALFTVIPLNTVTAVTAAPSDAQTQRISNLKTRGAAEIDRRIAALKAVQAKTAEVKNISAANRAAINAQLTGELAGLAALKAKLTADTTLVEARADAASIVSEYRVYALMLPKARLVVAADQFAAAEDRLAQIGAKLQSKVAAAKTRGENTAAAETALEDLWRGVDTARARTAPMTADLLALQPSTYNADHAVLVGYRTTMGEAYQDIKAARAEIAAIEAALAASAKKAGTQSN